MVTIMEVSDEEDLIIITNKGMVIRQSMADIKTMGRNTQGVRLIKLKPDHIVGDVAKVPKETSN